MLETWQVVLLIWCGALFGITVGWALADKLLTRDRQEIADAAVQEHEASLRDAEVGWLTAKLTEHFDHVEQCPAPFHAFAYYPITAALTEEQIAEHMRSIRMDRELARLLTGSEGGQSS